MNRCVVSIFAILMAIVFTAGGCDSKHERAGVRYTGGYTGWGNRAPDASNVRKPGQKRKPTIQDVIRDAKNGNPKAQYILFRCLLNGKGLAKNELEAVKWCHQSAKRKFPPAQFAMGYIFENGIAVKKDYSKAYYWYVEASISCYPGANEAADRMEEIVNDIEDEKIDRMIRESAEELEWREFKEQEEMDKILYPSLYNDD